MALKIHVKFEGKLTCAFKNDKRNLANFHRLKNSNFILERKMAELNQNQNSKKPDRPYPVCEDVILLWKQIAQLTKLFTRVLQNLCS